MKACLSLICPLLLLTTAAPAALANDCAPTKRDAKGPYYVSDTPVVDDLNRFGKQGERMKITGEIRGSEPPYAPIPNAKVELWQTDGEGDYYPQDNGDYSDYEDHEIDMRGTVITGSDGSFSLMSLFPAEYWPRPSHIHYQITADGYQTLVTQHYLDTTRAGGPCRSAMVDRSAEPAHFQAPVIYLVKN